MSPKKQAKGTTSKTNRNRLFPDAEFNYSTTVERSRKAEIVAFAPNDIVIKKNNFLANILLMLKSSKIT